MAEHELNKIVDDDGEVFNLRDSTKQPVADRVTAWGSTPSDTKYPSEKLVKDGLDAKADADKVVAIADAMIRRVGQTGSGWYKLAELTSPSLYDNVNYCFDVYASTDSRKLAGRLDVAIRTGNSAGTSVGIPLKKFYSDAWLSDYKFKIVIRGLTGSATIELWASCLRDFGGLAISERNTSSYTANNKKDKWTYTSYVNNGGSAAPVTDETNKVKVVDVDVVYRQLAIASPTNDNLVAMDANGLVKDSGIGSGTLNTALTKLNGIAEGAEVNVQSDWNVTDSTSDAFIKNKPYFTKYIDATGVKFKVCTVLKYTAGGTGSAGIDVFYRRGSGAVHGELIHKVTYELYLERIGDVSSNTNTIKFYYIENPDNSSYIDIYADSGSYCRFMAAPMANMPKDRVDFTGFGTAVSSIPEGATEITPVWVANSASSSGTAPVKVDAYGTLTAVPMDSTPTASSTNLMTSGAIKTALDGKAASSHTHGNITSGGALQTNDITIANGDKLVVTDSSDSNKVARTSVSFDGSTTTQALTKAGTWATFNNYSHPAGSAPSKTGVPTGNVSPGFGGTFKVNQITTDSTSHVSAVTERTITIPNATATTSAAGLMSAADKTKLDNAEDNVVYSSGTNCYGILLTELTVSTSVGTAEYVGTIYLDANFGIQNQTKEIIDVKFVFRSGRYVVWHANAEHHMSHLNSAAPVRIAYKTDANKAYIYLLWNAEGSSTAGNYAVRMKTFSKWGCVTITYPLTILSAQLTGFTLFTSNYMVKSALRTAVGGANAPVYVDSSGEIQACTTYANATVGTASKLGSATLGSGTKPIYLSSGTPTECTTYAGGTAVTLNNASKAGSTASFYAPTAGGTANYVLIGNGTTSAPTWAEKAPKAVVADYSAGFSERRTSWTWGTLTVANGYTQVTDWHTSNGSDIAFAEKSGSVSVQIDGKFYQNDGANKVLDAADVSIPSTVPTLAWNTESTLATIDGKNIKVKLPASPDTDTKQNITLATTTKAFITGVSTTPTSTAQALTGLADTGVYLTKTAGELNATQYKVNEHCTMKYNSTKSSLDFTFS